MVDPTKTVTNPRIAKLLQYEDKLDDTDRAELDSYRAQGLAPKSDKASATEGERKASAFLSRALGSNTSYEASGTGPRSLIGQRLADSAPNVLNSLPGFIGNSDDRQISDSAQDEFIAASLRQDSGAAIPPDELTRQRRIYFPMPGDEDSVIAQKRQARLRALDGLYQSAGRGLTPEQKAEYGKLKEQIDRAIRGEQEPTAATDQEGKERLSLLNAPVAALDVATGVRGGPLGVDVGNTASTQTPEFRAGLNALLDDPKTTKDQILAYWDKNAPGALEKGADPRPEPIAMDRGERPLFDKMDALATGMADTATLGLAPRLSALSDTVTEGGTYHENLDRWRGLDSYDEQVNPGFRIAGQLAGGLAIPSGVAGAGLRAEEAALAAGKGLSEAKVAARYGIAKRMGLEGAGIGAAYGFNSNYGDLGERVRSGVMGGVAGGALGYGLGRIVGPRGNDIPGPDDVLPDGSGGASPVRPSDMRGVANRLGITPTPATTGGGVASGLQRTLGNLPGSAAPIRNAVDAETEALGEAAKRVAGSMGPVGTPADAGAILTRGARVADKKAVRQAGDVYNARTEMMGGDNAPVLLGSTAKSLENIGRDFPSNPVLSELLQHPVVRKMGNIAGDADAELTLGEATSLLSEVRRLKNKAVAGPSGSQPKEFRDNLRAIEQAVEDDVMNAARASDAIAGRAPEAGAANAQVEGDKLYSEAMRSRERELGTALRSIADDVKVPAERVYGQLFSAMNEKGGNLSLLRKSMAKLPEKAKAAFAASAFDDLGRAIDSAQNARSDVWSFQTFATNWAKQSDDAKRLVYGGRGVDREISDIVRYVDRLRDIDKSRNFSNTAPNALAGGTLISALTALATGQVGTAAGIGGAYAGLNGIGRAFVGTPALRQWTRSALSASAKGNETQLRTLVRRLPTLAAKNPEVSGEIAKLESYLLNAANDNLTRAAASGGNKGDQEKR